MPDLGGEISGVGGAVSSLFSGIGEFEAAGGYKTAAKYAEENAQIAQQTSDIQQEMTRRRVYQSIGGTQAAEGGAGLATSGSATDILRSSAQQGALTKQLVQRQGAINVLGYQAEAASYQGMAAQATASGIGGIFGGILKGVAAFI